MRKILFATHGHMADGVLSAVKLILGDAVDVDTINAYLDGRSPEDQIRTYFGSMKEDDRVIVLTDLLGGSVNKEVLPYIRNPHVHVIAGMNLAMALEIASMSDEEEITEEFCRNLVEMAKAQVVYVNDCIKEKEEEEEFE